MKFASPLSFFHAPSRIVFLTCCALLILMQNVRAEAGARPDIRELGRKKSAELCPAVVTLKIVCSVKYSFSGREGEEREVRSETRGTIMDETGLTLCALSEIDPTMLWKRMLGSRMNDEMRMESTLKDLKIVMADNKEIASTVVLRDNDLDVAVIRPLEKPKEKLPFLDFKNSADAKLLDPIFVISRMGTIGSRQVRLMTGEIESVITRPRPFFVPSQSLDSGGTGVPAFNADGKILGLILRRSIKGSADVEQIQQDQSVISIILPCADLLELAVQAPLKAPEKSDDKAAENESSSPAGEKSKKEMKSPADDHSPASEKEKQNENSNTGSKAQ